MECEVENKRGGEGGVAAGRVMDGDRGNREGGMERKRRIKKPASISLNYLIQQKG